MQITKPHSDWPKSARPTLGALAPTIAALLFIVLFALARQAHGQAAAPALELRPCAGPAGAGEFRCGRFEVFEDREGRRGRKIHLNVVVLPARSPQPAPDPVFVIAGGPGQTATEMAARLGQSWMREERDIVLVDQRGTGGDNRLDCKLPGSDDDLQGYFGPMFELEAFQRCRDELSASWDLSRYTTALAMDDLNDVRAALGYDKINLAGSSYGTRAALVFLQRHPERVRTATLNGLAPTALKNPLYHARSAQDALEGLLSACEAEEPCRRAFPDIRREFDAVLTRLRREHAAVAIAHPKTGAAVTIRLSAEQFGEALRVLMYNTESAQSVPLLIHRAYQGDLAPFVRAGLASNRGIRSGLRFGMLQSVVCAEDIPRITEEEIARETAGTFLGDSRVRQQIVACEGWPQGRTYPSDFEPVRAPVPVLLVSGSHDPVTPSRWGDEAARHLPNGIHVVLPGGHGARTPCGDAIAREFLRSGSMEGVDTSCVAGDKLPPFLLSEGDRSAAERRPK